MACWICGAEGLEYEDGVDARDRPPTLGPMDYLLKYLQELVLPRPRLGRSTSRARTPRSPAPRPPSRARGPRAAARPRGRCGRPRSSRTRAPRSRPRTAAARARPRARRPWRPRGRGRRRRAWPRRARAPCWSCGPAAAAGGPWWIVVAMRASRAAVARVGQPLSLPRGQWQFLSDQRFCDRTNTATVRTCLQGELSNTQRSPYMKGWTGSHGGAPVLNMGARTGLTRLPRRRRSRPPSSDGACYDGATRRGRSSPRIWPAARRPPIPRSRGPWSAR